MEKVSVIVTTYNRKEYLTETLNSILNQTFIDFELIVVDNYSNYDFLGHIKSFNDSRIRPFQNQNNGIISVNRNFGIKKSECEFIAFCDDDDIWIDTKLEIQLNKIIETKAELVCSNMSIFEGDKNNILIKTKNRKPKNIYDLIWLNQVYTSTVIVKKSKHLLFNEDINLITVEDYGLWINLLNFGYKFEFIDEELVYYRKASDGAYRNNYKRKNLKLIYLYLSVLNINKTIAHKSWVLIMIAIQTFKYIGKVAMRVVAGSKT
jgi:glycosyltransferase involved in cell wall biosynthesis